MGKTYAIHDFITKNYENVIETDFMKLSEFKAIFAEGREIDRVMKCISLIELSFKAVPQGIGPLSLVRRLVMEKHRKLKPRFPAFIF